MPPATRGRKAFWGGTAIAGCSNRTKVLACNSLNFPKRLALQQKKSIDLRRKPIRNYMKFPEKPAWHRWPCRFLCASGWLRFVKWGMDFSNIGKIDFNRDMFPSAYFLRAVNHNPVAHLPWKRSATRSAISGFQYFGRLFKFFSHSCRLPSFCASANALTNCKAFSSSPRKITNPHSRL